MHADLSRAEWQQTPATVEAIAASLGLPLHVVRHGQHDMVSRWQDRFERGLARYAALETLCLIGPWSSPSPSLRFCTSEFKAAVITRFLRASFPGDEIISVIGIRRDERTGRRNAPISAIDTRLADARGTRGLVRHPLVDWQTADVFDLHAHAGLPLRDAYTVFGSTRLSCGFCIMSSLRDMLASASCGGNHGLYQLLVDLELNSAFSFQAGRWLADVAPALLSARQLAAVGDAKCRASERRQLEASLPSGLRYVKGWPPRVPSLDEAATIAATRTVIARHNRLTAHFLPASGVRDRFAELIAIRTTKQIPA